MYQCTPLTFLSGYNVQPVASQGWVAIFAGIFSVPPAPAHALKRGEAGASRKIAVSGPASAGPGDLPGLPGVLRGIKRTRLTGFSEIQQVSLPALPPPCPSLLGPGQGRLCPSGHQLTALLPRVAAQPGASPGEGAESARVAQPPQDTGPGLREDGRRLRGRKLILFFRGAVDRTDL